MCARIPLVVINYKSSNETINCIKAAFDKLNTLSTIFLIDNSKEESADSFAKFEQSRGRRLSKLDGNLAATLDKRVSISDAWTSGELVYLPTYSNTGFTGGSNIGIKVAQAVDSEYVFFLNPDARVKRGLLSELKELIERPKVGMVAPALTSRKNPTERQNEPVKLNPCRGYSSTDIREDSNKAIYNVDFLSGCALLVDLDVFEDVELFNEQFFLYVDDLDLSVRAKNSGWQLLYHDGVTVEHESTPRGELSAYYGTRNRLYLIMNHLTGWCFLTAAYWFLASQLVLCGYWTKKNRLENVRGTLMGVRDFLQGKEGKR